MRIDYVRDYQNLAKNIDRNMEIVQRHLERGEEVAHHTKILFQWRKRALVEFYMKRAELVKRYGTGA